MLCGGGGGPAVALAAFAFAHPAPPAFAHASLSPAGARWEETLGEYILDWDDVHAALAAGDAARAALLVERHIGTRLAWGEGATVTRWLAGS